MTPSRPTYPLDEIKRLVADGRVLITRTAAKDARLLGFGPDDIVDCILNLPASSFYKTMPAEKRPGAYQDVYRTQYENHPIYLKLQMGARRMAVTISFKRDESHV